MKKYTHNLRKNNPLKRGAGPEGIAMYPPGSQALQRKENHTGLPDQLKYGIEAMGGHTMDDVKVHYNSPRPAQLNAHAFAQGTDIHLAAGQERHLPHEAWHVVQQKQGRVQPTTSINGAQVNDSPLLEKEADVMGSRAIQRKKEYNASSPAETSGSPVIQQIPKDIPAPDKQQVMIMDMLNERNHAIVRRYKLVEKGTHGTNWIHAINIMRQGIKLNIDQADRTSEVTPENAGFYVDISESGKGQAPEFAEMAAFGTATEVPDELWENNYPEASKLHDKYQAEFRDHVKARKGTRRAIILQIWGPATAKPEARKKGQQEDEDIYKKHAHLLVATLKDSI
jgi:hypothetical protein